MCSTFNFTNLNVEWLDHWSSLCRCQLLCHQDQYSPFQQACQRIRNTFFSTSTPNSNPLYSIAVFALVMLPLADGLPAPNQSVVSNYLMQKLELPYTMMHNGFRFSTRNWEAQYNYGAGFIQPPQTLAPHRPFPCYTRAPETYPIPFNPGHATLSQLSSVWLQTSMAQYQYTGDQGW